MHQNLAVIQWQFNLGENSDIVLVPGRIRQHQMMLPLVELRYRRHLGRHVVRLANE